MISLVESQGYAPDELRSLLSWMLRDRNLIKDEQQRFYWYDRFRPLAMKSGHLLVKSLFEDHASAPTELIRRVGEFVAQTPASRDPYVAIQLMDDISRYPVDLNLSRAYTLAMQGNGMKRHKATNEWVEEVELEDGELAYSLQEFRRILSECDKSKGVSEDDAKAMGVIVIRVQQWCKQNGYPGLLEESIEVLQEDPNLRFLVDKSALALLWRDLFDHAASRNDWNVIRERLAPAVMMSKFVSETLWSRANAMTLLFAIYTMMDVGIVPHQPGKEYQEVIEGIMSSRDTRERLVIPSFAVDKYTYRGRNCVDTTPKLLALLDNPRFLSREDIHTKYHPIEASHGNSPHDARQTAVDYRRMMEEIESKLSSEAIPKLFEMTQEEDEDEDDDEAKEKAIKRLQTEHWRIVTEVALSEPFDDKTMSPYSQKNDQSLFVDFGSGTTIFGPVFHIEALKALAVSQIATKWAELKTVPEVSLRIDARRAKVFIQKPLIGTPLEDTIALGKTELEDCSLHPLHTRQLMEKLTTERQLDVVKSYIFRRVMGMACSPSKCLLDEFTGKIYMTNLQVFKRESQRCQKTVKMGSAYWLFDSSRCRSAVDFMSKILESESFTSEVMTWLQGLLNKNPWESTIPKSLMSYVISFEDMRENVSAIVNAYLEKKTAEEKADDDE